MWVVTVGLGLVILTIWLLWRKRQFSVLKELGIPGPEPNILFGNLWELSSKTPLECHSKWIKQYGRILGIDKKSGPVNITRERRKLETWILQNHLCAYYFGAKPIILIADADLLKTIQVSEFRHFVNRPQIFQTSRRSTGDRGFSKSLTSLRDKRWKEIRSITTPSFTTNKMKLMTPIMISAIDSLVHNIDEKAKTGETFDIYKMYQGLTMDVIGRTAFGIHTDVQNNPNDPFLRSSRILLSGSISSLLSVFGLSFPEFGFIWSFIRPFRLRLKNQGKNPITELIDSVTDVIKMRRSDKSARRNDLLQSMVDAEISEADLRNVKDQDLIAGDDEHDKEMEANAAPMKQSQKLLRHMTDEEIIDNAVLFFLAGYETTSTALAFTTHFLINYPDVQERIREEVNDLLQREGTLSYTSVQKLKYMDQVFCESLRMYPPIYFFVNREAGEDMTFGNKQIKKGFPVQVPVYALHHDPELWTDPEKFNPDRFSAENKSTHHPMAWQPFGAGPRNCIGMRFAQMEAKLALAQILQKYRLLSTDESDKEPINLRISAVTLTPGRGVLVKAVPL